MVFFICAVCNECLKKHKVETHSYSCRNAWYYNCMDCSKRFDAETYKQHTSCITESQKYEGKYYVAKENKGDVKQQAWLEGVQSRLDASPGMCIRRPPIRNPPRQPRPRVDVRMHRTCTEHAQNMHRR